jgi:hypothetical protein
VANYNAATGTQINAMSGLNVNPITRAEAFPTRNSSTYPNADPLSTYTALVPSLVQLAEGLTGVRLPNFDRVTTAAGTTPPNPPNISLNPADEDGATATAWYTNNPHPSFIVGLTGITDLWTPPTDYADGTTGTNATLYMNGEQYTQEPLAQGTYTVTGTLTDFYGNTSALATAPRKLVVDETPPSGNLYLLVDKIGGLFETNQETIPLQLSFLDPGAPLAVVQISTNGGSSWGLPSPYATSLGVTLPSANGWYDIGVKVTDLAGNFTESFQSVLFNNQGPSITTILSPTTNGNGYDLGKLITVIVSNSDLTPITKTVVTLDNNPVTGNTIDPDNLTAGEHTLLVTVTDALGNVRQQSTPLNINPTLPGMITAINNMTTGSLIPAATGATLIGILQSGQSLSSELNSFTTAVQALSLLIGGNEATLMLSWAVYVL